MRVVGAQSRNACDGITTHRRRAHDASRERRALNRRLAAEVTAPSPPCATGEIPPGEIPHGEFPPASVGLRQAHPRAPAVSWWTGNKTDTNLRARRGLGAGIELAMRVGEPGNVLQAPPPNELILWVPAHL